MRSAVELVELLLQVFDEFYYAVHPTSALCCLLRHLRNLLWFYINLTVVLSQVLFADNDKAITICVCFLVRLIDVEVIWLLHTVIVLPLFLFDLRFDGRVDEVCIFEECEYLREVFEQQKYVVIACTHLVHAVTFQNL